jgi:hypothetical protein
MYRSTFRDALGGGFIEPMPRLRGEALDHANYPAGRSMKEAKKICRITKTLCFDCPLRDCRLTDWDIAKDNRMSML